QHRAGVRPYTSSCDFAEPCVFSKQSLPPAICDLFLLPLFTVTYSRHTFFQSYGVNLLSSLTRVLSIALGYSPYLPELVFSTGTRVTRYAAFLGSWGFTTRRNPKESSRPGSQACVPRIYQRNALRPIKPDPHGL